MVIKVPPLGTMLPGKTEPNDILQDVDNPVFQDVFRPFCCCTPFSNQTQEQVLI